MESFQPSGASTHRPLQGNEIRVVTLHPGSFDDPVFCTLDHVVLDGPRDDYIAISYTWGDPTQTKDINLNGHSYPATTNLHLALTYLRNENEPRRLWIDSLCINQRDVAERNAQVPRMRDVYAFAAEVNVWLGDYGTVSQSSWRHTFDLCIKVAVIFKKQLYFQVPGVKEIMDTLLERPWFQRMWVIQEVAVRNWKEDGEKVQFLVGHLSLTWSILDMVCGDIVNHLFHMDGFGKPLSTGRSYGSRKLFQIRTAWEAEHRVRESSMQGVSQTISQQLAYLLSRFVNFKVTDPRDRIYSLLGLLYGPEKVPNDLAPDYSKPVDEVFHAYAAWMLGDGGCIDILSLNSRQRVGRRCPSWVPDFQGQTQNFWHCPVDRGSNPIRILQENGVLEIDALIIGTVQTVGRRCKILEESRVMRLLDPALEFHVIWGCRQYLLDCETWIQVHAGVVIDPAPWKFNEYLLSDYFEKSFHGFQIATYMPRFATFGDAYNAIRAFCKEGRSVASHDIWDKVDKCSEYAYFIAQEFDGFTPFMCDNGKLEFCNSKVDVPEPGDVLCLLRGSSKQYILRRAPPDSLGEWIMVGTTYNVADFSYVDLSRGDRSEEEVNLAYTELWTKNADKIFKAVIC
ncbi:heterokaryon incompatibility protein-domain-containing protein [Neurospora hispaniola]|uniref:Heterokaryon incompatibility protein-domain-containing protein n=1 Tax=Neurospora hispaniola TaxID=588809 RepID=A0AAJ0MRV4_9PEZI|nr:heterokaryon incompatibility protein-domain-containing protein [Neurospora hispaniola]